jgi:hypothetical protein
LTEEDFDDEETQEAYLQPQTELLVCNTNTGTILAIEAGVEHAVPYSVVEFTAIISGDPHVTDYLHQCDSVSDAEDKIQSEMRDRMD